LKTFRGIILVLILVFAKTLLAQTIAFKDQNKWGVKENDRILIPAKYDTLINFEAKGNVCLACCTTKVMVANRFIKTSTINYFCNYLNRKHEKLSIVLENGDTCSVFGFGKTSVKQLTENPSGFTVIAKGKKYLVDKTFKQLTAKGYYDVNFSLDKNFYHAEKMDDNEQVYSGLIDLQEKEIIPFHYSKIKINPIDSLISGCAAGVGNNLEDDIYTYDGKKVDSYRRHIDLATKNFIIHKLFEPKEHFIIYNVKTKEEKNLKADEVYFYEHDEILIKIKNDWYIYNLFTNQKKSKQI
jgi:hypothetical protein